MAVPKQYLRLLDPTQLFGKPRRQRILNVNPTISAVSRKDSEHVQVTVYEYNAEKMQECVVKSVADVKEFNNEDSIIWVNIDGIRKADIEKLSAELGIHALIAEDILSIGQRPKMDEVDNILYCLLNMLYYNSTACSVEQEQISIVLGKGFVLTFQEDPQQDVFNPIRDRLRIAGSKVRQRGADYLYYQMLDLIVDNYFLVIEKLGEKIEDLEEEVIRRGDKRSLVHINNLRKELIVLKRNIAPVRDLVGAVIRSESELLDETTTRYFNDVHDHIMQAYDLSENYRDMMISMQDLYINNVNLRMNEVMKVMAIVTCLMAPATVIGGIFGMNFDIIPTLHKQWGFYTAVGGMLFIPVGMLLMFKRRGWF